MVLQVRIQVVRWLHCLNTLIMFHFQHEESCGRESERVPQYVYRTSAVVRTIFTSNTMTLKREMWLCARRKCVFHLSEVVILRYLWISQAKNSNFLKYTQRCCNNYYILSTDIFVNYKLIKKISCIIFLICSK